MSLIVRDSWLPDEIKYEESAACPRCGGEGWTTYGCYRHYGKQAADLPCGWYPIYYECKFCGGRGRVPAR